ncbi:MAG: hypothetical protein WD737_05450 [Gemmatimonadota bacterium]
MRRYKGGVVTTVVVVTMAACAAQTPGPEAAGVPEETGEPPVVEEPVAAEPVEEGPVSVYAGVYTEAQAQRGDEIQQIECGACHSSSEWAQGRLLAAYNGLTARRLVNQIRETMPLTAPGILSLQEYTDIVAFIFELNEIPPGDTELPADEEALDQIELEYRR